MTTTTVRRLAVILALTGLAATASVGGSGAATARTDPDPGTSTSPGTGRDAASGRGRLVSTQPLRHLSTKEDVAAELTAGGFDPASARYGVQTYQLVYRTVDATGRPTIAGGLLALPAGGERHLRTVSFTHGTEINRTDAPSLWRDVWAVAPALTYASAGFAAVAPDYLGLGLGPGPHPFLDVPSETTAAVDLLRAARQFATDRVLRRDVLVTGFSQGATAALGLARALQGGADGWFRLGAVAPIAGAYDWQNVELPALLSGAVGPPWNIGYTTYFIVAWNRLHRLYDRPGEVFRAPYDAVAERLFDGVHTGEDLVNGLPDSIDKLLTPHGLNLLRNPTGRLAEAVRVHDSTCADWTPRVPVRLYLSGGDDQVPRANSEHCRASLRARGVDAPIVDVGDLEHNGSIHLGANVRGTAAIVRWFAQLT